MNRQWYIVLFICMMSISHEALCDIKNSECDSIIDRVEKFIKEKKYALARNNAKAAIQCGKDQIPTEDSLLIAHADSLIAHINYIIANQDKIIEETKAKEKFQREKATFQENLAYTKSMALKSTDALNRKDVLKSLKYAINSVTRLPTHDGRLALRQAIDKAPIIKQKFKLDYEENSGYLPWRSIAISGNGQYIAASFDERSAEEMSLDRDGLIYVWEIASGKLITTIAHPQHVVHYIDFSENCRYLLSQGEKRIKPRSNYITKIESILVWDLSINKKVVITTANNAWFMESDNSKIKISIQNYSENITKMIDLQTNKILDSSKTSNSRGYSDSNDRKPYWSNYKQFQITLKKSKLWKERKKIKNFKYNSSKSVAAFNIEGRVYLFKNKQLKALMNLDDDITSIAISGDGSTVTAVTRIFTQTVNILDNTTYPKIDLKEMGEFSSKRLSMTCKYLAVRQSDYRSNDCIIKVYNNHTGEKIFETKHDEKSDLAESNWSSNIAFSDDEKYCLIDNEVVDLTLKSTCAYLYNEIGDVNFLPNNNVIDVKSNEIWVEEFNNTLPSFSITSSEPNKMTFSSDGKMLAFLSGDFIKQWDVEKELESGSIKISEYFPSPHIKYCLNNDFMLVQSANLFNPKMTVYKLSDKSIVSETKFQGVMMHGEKSPNDDIIAFANMAGQVVFWKLPELEIIDTFEHRYQIPNGLSFNKNPPWLALAVNVLGAQKGINVSVSNVQCPIIVRDLINRDMITEFYHQGWISDIHFDQSTNRLISCSIDGTVRIWNVEKNIEEKRFVDSTQSFTEVIVARNKIIASSNEIINIWDKETNKLIKSLYPPSDINDICISPDSLYLASASKDGSVYIWDIKTGEEVSVLKYKNEALSVCFQYDGRRIITAEANNRIHFSIWRDDELLEYGKKLLSAYFN